MRTAVRTAVRVAVPAGVLVGALFIGWLRPQAVIAHAQVTTTVQFDREIVHVLDNHCVMCHVEKGLAFPLVTYEQTYAARWKIRQDALDRHMAPWAAVAGYGDFANGNGLTQREIDFLVSWAESFGPRNNGEVYSGVAAQPTAAKAVQARSDVGGWVLGKPDVVLAVGPKTVGAREGEEIERIVVDPKLATDRWLRGLEYKPGDRRVVRAVSFAIQETGQWIGSWTPWYGFVSLPAGLAYRLPAGSHVVAEIHYNGSREKALDQGALGLYFAEQPSARVVTSLVLNATAAAPTGAAQSAGVSRKLEAATRLEEDLNILALLPEIRPGVRSIEVAAKAPGGGKQVLLFAKDIPLEWPTPYVFRKPVSLVKGTELSVIEHYAGDAAHAGDAGPAGGIPVTFSAYRGAALAAGAVPVTVSAYQGAALAAGGSSAALAGGR